MIVQNFAAHGGSRGNATGTYFFIKGCLAVWIWVLGCCVACVGLLAIVLSRENGGPRAVLCSTMYYFGSTDEMICFATQGKDPCNVPTARAMIMHGIIRRCPTTIPRFVGIIHRSTRANAGFGGNHGNSGEVGRMVKLFGREDRAPRELVGFVAMYVRWWVRGNYWYFAAGAKFWHIGP